MHHQIMNIRLPSPNASLARFVFGYVTDHRICSIQRHARTPRSLPSHKYRMLRNLVYRSPKGPLNKPNQTSINPTAFNS